MDLHIHTWYTNTHVYRNRRNIVGTRNISGSHGPPGSELLCV